MEALNLKTVLQRAEFLKFIITALEADVSENNISLPFSDTYNSEWYAPYVSAALNLKNGQWI